MQALGVDSTAAGVRVANVSSASATTISGTVTQPATVTLHEDVMNAVSAMINQGLLSGPQALKATLELSNLSPAVKQAIVTAGASPQPSPEQAQLQQAAVDLQLRGAASKIAKTEAETDKLRAETGHTAARTDAVGIEAEQHAVNTAATIADIAQKTARTRQIGTETAQAHMDALGMPALAAAFAPRPLVRPLQGLPA
ncbi:hypothetical protein Q8W71_17855 [Methylobacterium sp. NEAU 140]|uniref:hypothetical protein n=1 Tax=Methylobacterium sp. NEAU 140 TaxID=3064945 RepID=UPI00273642F1|nr:hypothetical protein [Methylobacterium sp. NEAU 140]MDP4024492.1 hypothetical protein [Methylobacterium sp. NEAU 140]